MKKKNLFLIILIFIPFTIFAQIIETNDDILDGYIHRGIKSTIMQNYNEAISTFDSLKLFTHNDPRPYFYHAAALQASMMDFENYNEDNSFFKLIDKTIDHAEKWIAKDSLKVVGNFFKGAALSYRSLFYAQRKEYLNALRDAMIGIQFLEKTLAVDSTFYDAYLGIGSYKYWRSRLTQNFSWLPFFPDQRNEGISMIKKSIQFGLYGKDVAYNSLIWVEIDRGEFEQAIQMVLEIEKKYPGSRYFLWPLAEAYFRAGKFDNAVLQYQKLINSYRQEEKNNYYNEIVCGLKIAQIRFLQKKYDHSLEIATKLFKISLDSEVKKRLKDKLEELKEISKNCTELMNQY